MYPKKPSCTTHETYSTPIKHRNALTYNNIQKHVKTGRAKPQSRRNGPQLPRQQPQLPSTDVDAETNTLPSSINVHGGMFFVTTKFVQISR